MPTSILTKALWDRRRSLLGWASAVVVAVMVESAMWPSLREMPNFQQYLDDFPDALSELFSFDAMATGHGFLNAELFTLMLPLLFIIYGIGTGARLLAGEEESGTLDLLLVSRTSPARIIVEQAVALVAELAALGLALLVATLAGSAVFGLGISVPTALSGVLAVVLLGVEFGIVALGAGAMTGHRGRAVGVATLAALVSYLLYLGGVFVGALEPYRGWSPFQQALHAGPLAPGLPASYLWLVLVPLVVMSVVTPLWARRDIGAAR